MKQPNILITSAGKRVELVKEFQATLKRFYPSGKVLTVDLNPKMAPACLVSDGWFQVPRVTDKNYPEILLDICRRENVKIVIPTIDTELLVLSDNYQHFQKGKIEILISDASFIKLCRDKRLTNVFFKDHKIEIPEERDKMNPVFPMFAKPYDGSLSTNIHLIRKKEELTSEIMNDEKLMFMEVIDKENFKEFTVDLYYSKDNRLKCIVPRERIEIRSGEVNKGGARKNYLMDYIKERMTYLPGVRGCICMQVFFNEATKEVKGIEINPRFGGGYPLSYYAGANFQEMIIKEYLNNESLDYFEGWRDNTIMLRYDSQVISYE